MLSGRGVSRGKADLQQHILGGSPQRTPIHRKLLNWAKAALGLHPMQRLPPPSEPPAVEAPRGPSGRLRLAVVGDVHGAWQPHRDEAALRLLAPDLTLLVGDFGNENVELVKQIAALPLPKAIILGNHDAWYSLTSRTRRGVVRHMLSAADILSAMGRGEGAAHEADGVDQQLAELGDSHMGYSRIALEEHGYTVVGARPFSKGGNNFTSIKAFMDRMYGVKSMEESAARIVQVALGAPDHHPLIVMGHNGPAGLGARHFDPCGVDWEPKAGDHGDPDLQTALANLQAAGRRVALVTFGHMHHTLHPGSHRGTRSRFRRMVALDPATGTVFLNAATVPRITSAPTTAGPSPPSSPPSTSPTTSQRPLGSGKRARVAAKTAATVAAVAGRQVGLGITNPREAHPTMHHFLLVELEEGKVVRARDVWVQVTPVTDESAAAVLESMIAAAAAAAVNAAATTAAGPATASSALNDRSPQRSSSDGGFGFQDAMTGCNEPNETQKATHGISDDEESAGTSCGLSIEPQRIGNFIVQVAKEHVVLRTVVGEGGGVVKFVWNAYDQQYESYVMHQSTMATHGPPEQCVTQIAGSEKVATTSVGAQSPHPSRQTVC